MSSNNAVNIDTLGHMATANDCERRWMLANDEVERLSALLKEVSGTLESVVVDRDFQRDGAARLAAERDAIAQRMNAAQTEHAQQLNYAFGERDGQILQLKESIGERDGRLRQASGMLGERDSQLRQATAMLGERNRQLLHVHGVLGERDRQLRHMRGGLDERDKQLCQLAVELSERANQIGRLEAQRGNLLLEAETLHASMVQLHAKFTELDSARASQAQAMEARMREGNASNAQLAATIAGLYRSKSWRVTAPLRAMVRLLSRVKGGAAAPSTAPAPVFAPAAAVAEPLTIVEPVALAQPVAIAEPDAYVEPAPIAAPEAPVATAWPDGESKFRILLVSYYCPTRAHAGGLRILDMYALIREKCPNIQIDLLTHHRPSIDWSIDDLPGIFHNVYLAPGEELTPAGLAELRGSMAPYDVIDLQFHPTGYQIDAFRKIGAKILFTPMEAQAKVLLLDLRAKFNQSKGMRLLKMSPAIRTAASEIAFTEKADAVVCVSRADAAFLRAVTGSPRIRWVDTGVSSLEFAAALAPGFVPTPAAYRTCRVLYVAYFGSETNVNALRWYLDHVHPQIKASVPGYVLSVVGRGDMAPFAAYRDDSIEFVGEVPAIAPYIADARVCIAPALSGSGFRGKVNQYAVMGCPSVVSPIAAKGLAYQDGTDVFIAESPELFAQRCVQLLTDLELNDRLGQAARQLCMERYSWESKWPAVRRLYNLENQE